MRLAWWFAVAGVAALAVPGWAGAQAQPVTAEIVSVSGPSGSALAVGRPLSAGDRVELAPSQSVTLIYPRGCVEETVTGTGVTVGTVGSLAIGARVDRRAIACPSVPGQADPGLVSAARPGPFAGPPWQEATTRQRRPTFVWAPGRGPASIRVFAIEAAVLRLLWEGGTGTGTARYPSTAPALTPGSPYRVDVAIDGRTASVVFAVDPGFTPAGPDVLNVTP